MGNNVHQRAQAGHESGDVVIHGQRLIPLATRATLMTFNLVLNEQRMKEWKSRQKLKKTDGC